MGETKATPGWTGNPPFLFGGGYSSCKEKEILGEVSADAFCIRNWHTSLLRSRHPGSQVPPDSGRPSPVTGREAKAAGRKKGGGAQLGAVGSIKGARLSHSQTPKSWCVSGSLALSPPPLDSVYHPA